MYPSPTHQISIPGTVLVKVKMCFESAQIFTYNHRNFIMMHQRGGKIRLAIVFFCKIPITHLALHQKFLILEPQRIYMYALL